MFFLGLAGSFMPYLLLMGALFVLSLGVNIRGGQTVEPIAEKTISYEDSDQEIDEAVSTCYFFQDQKVNTQDNQDYHFASFIETKDFMRFITREKTRLRPEINHYSFTTYHTFFGLSPPALVS